MSLYSMCKRVLTQEPRYLHSCFGMLMDVYDDSHPHRHCAALVLSGFLEFSPKYCANSQRSPSDARKVICKNSPHYHQQKTPAQSKGIALWVIFLPNQNISVFQQSQEPTPGQRKNHSPFLRASWSRCQIFQSSLLTRGGITGFNHFLTLHSHHPYFSSGRHLVSLALSQQPVCFVLF